MEAIKEQEDKRVDIIGKINTEKTKGIEYSDEKAKKLKDLVEKIKKESKENKNKKFVYATTSNVQYDFNQLRDLKLFGNEIYTKILSLDEAKDKKKRNVRFN